MKVAKLIHKLVREIEQKTSTRDELLARASSLGEEIHELDMQCDLIAKLEARYSQDDPSEDRYSIARDEDDDEDEDYRGSRSTSSAPVASAPVASAPVASAPVASAPVVGSPIVAVESLRSAGEVAVTPARSAKEPLVGAWPIGPHYKKQFKAKTRQAWALYKLGTADWYLNTLREIAENVDKIDRFLGVEMAIDGALQALCATFDAAVFALLSTLETGANVPNDEKTPAHLASWETLVVRAEELGVSLPAAPAVRDALAADDPGAPEGWLAQLISLRARSGQHDLLIRHWPLGAGAPIVCIDVPGDMPRPPLDYLEHARNLIEALLMAMLDDQELLRLARDWSSAPRRVPSSVELPDLLRRAGIPPRD